MAGKRAIRRRIIVVAVTIATCLGIVSVRAVWEGRSALSQGNQASERGDHEEAIRWWRRAARWYLPAAPHIDAAYDNLEALAEAAEERGDVQLALAGWRAIRRSVNATRSFYTPQRDRLTRANEHIAGLMAELDQTRAGKSKAERREFHAELLARRVGPAVGWSLLAGLGLLLWVGGGLYFALRGVGADDRIVPPAARLAVIMIAVGLVIWMLGLYKA
ncbi:MAG: hypothetical protein KJO07_19515 [Deltaproteobacteria bacterium]|jgi:hypothetical protein|nr:hypothetical protein [Deltaproteobacteria bacterium]